MAAIRRDFSPADLEPLLAENKFDGSVVVQVDQSDAETEQLLKLAQENNFIKGVVGWIDLQANDLDWQLVRYRNEKRLKGFRHILQAEQPAFMLQPAFINGLQLLGKHGYSYDILVYPKHLPAVLELVRECPGQRLVIDHIAKPDIKAGTLHDWAKQMREIARQENVYCKLSGMVTEADWKQWKPEDFIPYLDVVAEAFGVDRLLFGSDWPVCLVAGSYHEVVDIVEDYFTSSEQQAVFGANAIKFYQL